MNGEQARAVFLTAVMVVSVAVAGVALAGGAAASDVDRNDTPGGDVDPGADGVEVFDFSISSEDQILVDDGDVEPGDELDAVGDNFSYVDDNQNTDFEGDESLIRDNDSSEDDDDTFNTTQGDEVVYHPDGAFRPYEFGDDRFFLDVNDDDDGDLGTYDGENFSDDGNITKEAIIEAEADGNITGDSEVLTTGLANVTEFSEDGIEGTLSIYDQDGDENGNDFEPGDEDFIFLNGDGDADYNESTDTILVGTDPNGDVSAGIYSVSGTDLADELYFLDFDQDGGYDSNFDDNGTADDLTDDTGGGEPIVTIEDGDYNATSSNGVLPNDAEFLEPGPGINNNYYEQYDDDDDDDLDVFGDGFEDGSDSLDNDSEVDDVGVQNLDGSNAIYLDDEQGSATYEGEDGEDEDVVENDLSNSNVLVDGTQENGNGEDIGPNTDGDDTPNEDGDDAVIRGNGDDNPEVFTEDDDDGNLELVLINDPNDLIDEGSDAFPGVGSGPDAVYGDALVDLTIANTGTATHQEDFSGVTLYRETDGESGFSDGDEFVESTTFEGNNALGIANGQFEFTNLNQVFGNDSARFYVTTDVQNNADEGDTLQFAIPQFRDGDIPNSFQRSSPFYGGASDTGLFLESSEDASTGPVTDADGDIENEDDYFPTFDDYEEEPASGPGPIVADEEQTIGGDGGDDGGDDGGEPAGENTITIVGSGEEASYDLSVTDDLQKSTANGANINARADTIRQGYVADGEVGISSDSYTYDGTLETIDLDGDAEVIVNGNTLTDAQIENMPDNAIEFRGTGPRATYDFSSDDESVGLQKLTANDANLNDNDDIFRTTANGVAGAGRDAYGFDGSIESLDAPDSLEVYVDGLEVDPDDTQDNVVTILGSGERAGYDLSVDDDLQKSTANFANINQRADTVSGNSATGEVGGSADSYVYDGDLDIDLDGDATVVVDGEQIDA